MIIGTVTLIMLYFGGGGGGFSFEKAFEPFVKDAVKDKSRYEQIVDLTKELDEDVKQFQTELSDVWVEELKKIVGDYDASEEQFRAFRSKADRSRTDLQQKFLDVRFKVVELMTEDEWNAMYGAIEEKANEKQK
jgi:hypothetical protein